MKAAFAHMGYIYVNLGAMVRHLGIELCMGSRPNRMTLAEGVRHSPEQFCIPFKANLGDLIASLNSGAEMLITVQGAWSCRFGYYGRLHHSILRDMGYEFESLILDGSRQSLVDACNVVKRANNVRSTAAALKIFLTAFRFALK
jgi:predicted nucleotide-binding protein (sugar kinase/HSP70/actin superfamily)